MPDQLVVARYKGETSPRFTKSCTIQELLVGLVERLPVDMIYFVVPHPDGKGYSLREAGLITLDLQPAESQSLPVQQPPPPSSIPALTPAHTLPFTFSDESLNFPRPKSQAELLAERGLEQPSSKPKRTRKRKPTTDENLPHPVSNSTRRVTSISTATPAEAEAASHFGES